MVGQCHQFKCEQTLGDSEGQGSLVCCSPWGHKELDVTQRLNNKSKVARTPLPLISLPNLGGPKLAQRSSMDEPPEYIFSVLEIRLTPLKGVSVSVLDTFHVLLFFLNFSSHTFTTAGHLSMVLIKAVSSFLQHPRSLLFLFCHLATRFMDFSVLESNYSVFKTNFLIHLGVQRTLKFQPLIEPSHITVYFGDHLVLFQYSFLNSQYPQFKQLTGC